MNSIMKRKSTPHIQSLTLILCLILAAGSSGKAQEPSADIPAAKTTGADLSQTQLGGELTKLGGKVKMEGGEIVEIIFTYTHTPSPSPTGQLVPPYEMTDDLMRQISKLPKLTSLELNMCPKLTDEGLKYLKDMTQLQRLALPGPCVTDVTMANIAGLTNLQFLRLSVASKISVDGWTNVEGMKQLQTLMIAETGIGDKGILHLKGLTQLKEVTLWGDKVTDAGAEIFKDFPNLRSLRCDDGISRSEVAKLKEALPNCQFSR